MPCAPGSYCAISGECVALISLEKAVEFETQRTESRRALGRRLKTRSWTRYAIGGGLGLTSDYSAEGLMFFVNLGVRKQLGDTFGLHVHGLLDAQSQHREVVGSVAAYFGPFGRAYFGPALLGGYRWHAGAPAAADTTTPPQSNAPLMQAGLRLGILAGTEEEFDFSWLLTFPIATDPAARLLFGLSYELR